MNITIEMSTADIKKLIIAELGMRLGNVRLNEQNVSIYVKTSQNYKSEWELGQFKVIYESMKP